MAGAADGGGLGKFPISHPRVPGGHPAGAPREAREVVRRRTLQQVQRVERLVGGLTQVRRVVSGYEMTTESYPTMLTLAPIPFLWL